MWKFLEYWIKIPRIYKRAFLIAIELYCIGYLLITGLRHSITETLFTVSITAVFALAVLTAIIYDSLRK